MSFIPYHPKSHIFLFYFMTPSIKTFPYCYFHHFFFLQTQRFAMEYTEIFEKSTTRISFWRRFTRYYTMVVKRMESHRFTAAERRNGVSSSEYRLSLLLSSDRYLFCNEFSFIDDLPSSLEWIQCWLFYSSWLFRTI